MHSTIVALPVYNVCVCMVYLHARACLIANRSCTDNKKCKQVLTFARHCLAGTRAHTDTGGA